MRNIKKMCSALTMTIALAMVIAACGTSQKKETESSEIISTEQDAADGAAVDTENNAESKYIIKGADISSLQAVEDCGGKFYDFDGNALPAIEAYSYETGSVDSDQALLVYPIENLTIDRNAEDEALLDELPEYASVLYMDGSSRQTPIEWDISSMKVITDTRVAFKGKVLDFDISVGADLVDR